MSLREFGKGKVVGTQTAGKGTIQCTPVTLSDGSAISYTVGILLDKEEMCIRDRCGTALPPTG